MITEFELQSLMYLARFFASVFNKPRAIRLPSAQELCASSAAGPGAGSHVRRACTALLATSLVALGACQITAPRSYPAATPLPGSYGYPAPNDSTSIGDLQWNQFFADKTLIGLIDTALQQNLDLCQASQRVEQARAAPLKAVDH